MLFFSGGLRGEQGVSLLQRFNWWGLNGAGNALARVYFLGAECFREEEKKWKPVFTWITFLSVLREPQSTRFKARVSRLRLELYGIGLVANPLNTVGPPPKGCTPAAEKTSLDERVNLCMYVEAGVPVGAEEYVLERAMEFSKSWRQRAPCA